MPRDDSTPLPPRTPAPVPDRTGSAGLRLLWTAAGMVALALGAIGAFLPVLPTTPFVLVAAFAFSKGSPRLRHWLVSHDLFGPAIADWEANGAIARPVKALACAMMALAFAASVLAGFKPVVLLIQALCLGAAATYVLTRPSGPREG